MLGANAGGWGNPTDYFHDNAAGKGTKWVTYTPTIPTNGTYEVYLWWVESSNRATNTPVDVIHAGGTNRFLVNQKNASGGWFKLMTTNFNAGTSGQVIIRNDNTAAGTYCIADGVRFLGIGGAAPVQPVVIELVASDAVAGEFPTNSGRFVFVRSGDTNAAVMINYAVSGSATPSVDYSALPGSVVLASGAMATNVFVTPFLDLLAEGDETVTLDLTTSANYSITTLTNATILLRDRPLDAWRKANFTALELSDPAISGDLANPDGDSVVNLVDYALGLAPKAADTNPLTPRIEANHLTITYTQAKAATDVLLTLEKSDDLITWSGSPALFQQVSVTDLGDLQQITTRLASPINASTASYIRLKVTRL